MGNSLRVLEHNSPQDYVDCVLLYMGGIGLEKMDKEHLGPAGDSYLRVQATSPDLGMIRKSLGSL